MTELLIKGQPVPWTIYQDALMEIQAANGRAASAETEVASALSRADSLAVEVTKQKRRADELLDTLSRTQDEAKRLRLHLEDAHARVEAVQARRAADLKEKKRAAEAAKKTEKPDLRATDIDMARVILAAFALGKGEA